MTDSETSENAALIPDVTTSNSWLKAILQKLKRLEVIGILVAALALSVDVIWKITKESPALERERAAQAVEREEASIAREMQAWAHLSRKSVGLDGYDVAINYLLERRGELSGLDMSCEAFGGQIPQFEKPIKKFEDRLCSPAIQFANWRITGNLAETGQNNTNNNERVKILSSFKGTYARFSETVFKNIAIDRPNFEGATFSESSIINSEMHVVNFTKADFYTFSFKDTVVGSKIMVVGSEANFTDTSFYWTDMTNFTCYWCDFTGATLQAVNLSNADFSTSRGLTPSMLRAPVAGMENYSSVWAWADQPPRFRQGLQMVTLCHPDLRDVIAPPYFHPYGTFRPMGCSDWQWADWPVQNLPDGQTIKSCDPAGRDAYYALPMDARPIIPAGCGSL